MFLLYLVFGGLLYTLGDVLGKYWALNNNWYYFWSGLFVYSIGGAFIFFAIREGSLTTALLVMPPVAITLSLLAGRFLFDEKISHLQYWAAAVILLAVCVLLWNPKL